MSFPPRLTGLVVIVGTVAAIILFVTLGAARGSGPAAESQAAHAATVTASALERGDLGMAGAVRLQVAPTGNEARYRIREQLLGFDFPSDAIGVTREIAGAIVVDEEGRLVPDESRLTIHVAGLTSDNDRRDNFVRGGRLLQTEDFPTVELRPTGLLGIEVIPNSGTHTFALVGDLTVREVTRETTWQVSAAFANGRVTGTAATQFSFGDFELAKPQVRSVLSVDDTIRLEYDFDLVVERR